MELVMPEKDWGLRKALSSKNRERILENISQRTMRVGELAKKLHISDTAVKKNVDFLERAKLVKSKVDFHSRGQRRIILPSDGLFKEGLDLPFLHKQPAYLKAIRLLQAYRGTMKMELPTDKSVEAIRQNVQRLAQRLEFKKIDEANGWHTQCRVLLGWCWIFISYFVEKVPLTLHKKEYPDNVSGVLVGYNVDIHQLARGISPPEPLDLPGTVYIEFLVMKRELEKENTPLSNLALEIIRKYESKIPDLPPEKKGILETVEKTLLQKLKEGAEIATQRSIEAKKRRLKILRGDHSEEWENLAKEFETELGIGTLFEKLRVRQATKD